MQSLKRLAVLLIDMQDHFIKGDQEKLAIIPSQISVLELCKKKSIFVVVVEFRDCGRTTKSLLAEIETLPRENLHVVKKSDNDSFVYTGLHAVLETRGITSLVLMGINAAYCVYATAKTAIQKGYSIITSEDLIAGYRGNDEPHCSGPEWYMQNGMYVRNHQVIFE